MSARGGPGYNEYLAREVFANINNAQSLQELREFWLYVEQLKKSRKMRAEVYEVLLKTAAHREKQIKAAHKTAKKAAPKKASAGRTAAKAPKKAPKKAAKAPKKAKAKPTKPKAKKPTKAEFKARMKAGKEKAAKARAAGKKK